jgi:haloacetate dehalogenase
MSALFTGFERKQIDVGGVTINCVVGGEGPPLLLLHGYPQTHAMWAGVAPRLTEDFTVICPDLRGYGDSSKPVGTADHSNYSFRAMAADQVAVMKVLGFAHFSVAGHDRGGRVAHRMALDWPKQVEAVSFLDIVPTHYMYGHTDRQFATTFWLWFFLPLPAPFPETMVGADPDYYFETCLGRYGGTGLDDYDPDVLAEYRRCWRDKAMIHASCSDYRAGASIDLVHDEADLGSKIQCPTLVLWAESGLMGKQFDFAAIWAERCRDLQTGTVPGGHFFPDLAPAETAESLRSFFSKAVRSS